MSTKEGCDSQMQQILVLQLRNMVLQMGWGVSPLILVDDDIGR